MTPPLRWNAAAFRADLLDQTRLPVEERWLPIETVESMAEAIRSLRVRGAPAIGIAAAYGVVLALSEPVENPRAAVQQAIDSLAETRPTAVNLFVALDRMRTVAEAVEEETAEALRSRLLKEAQTIEQEDREAGRRIGEHGLALLEDGMQLLTHCHAGGVATSGYGTALAPILVGHARGLGLHVYVDETRPLLQGSRITAWELLQAGVPATLITDGMAAHVMQTGRVDAVIVGADRIAANGDVANKIGTYGLAVLAEAHELPFYVAAPLSTVDFGTPTGAGIAIEERAANEVRRGFGRLTAPVDVPVYNPAFDVTPARRVTAIITEEGIARPPFAETLRELAQRPQQLPESAR